MCRTDATTCMHTDAHETHACIPQHLHEHILKAGCNMHMCALHVHLYVVLTLRRQDSGLNPRYYSCWDDEDFVGRLSQVSRRTHPRRLAASSIARHLSLLMARWRPDVPP
jgi:hypothetical protein